MLLQKTVPSWHDQAKPHSSKPDGQAFPADFATGPARIRLFLGKPAGIAQCNIFASRRESFEAAVA
jgi:hypothetical protein